MVNLILFRSSVFLGICHFMIPIFTKVSYFDKLMILYYFGIVTSLWNHGTTSSMAKWSDRVVMYVGCLSDFLFCLHHLVFCPFLLIYVTCYILAKCEQKNGFHITTHVVATGLHCFRAAVAVAVTC